MTETHVDETAAALEGLAVMPAHLIPLRDEFLSLKDQLDKLEARKNEIRDIFGEELKAGGFQGFLLYGKVHARRSPVTNTTVDGKKLKDKMPHIWKEFIKVTNSVRVTIN